MTFSSYQQLAAQTANRRIEPDLRLAAAGLGLAGEAGEVADHVKKILAHGYAKDLVQLKDELSDSLWYLAELATIFGLDLSEVALHNIEKLKKRYPLGFQPGGGVRDE